MISRIDDFTIRRVKDAANIVEVIGDFYQLRKKGTEYQCLCPFHNDRHLGSFSISPKKGIYQCFACGASGDAVTFLMKHERLNFPDAIRWLAKKYSIEVEGANRFAPTPSKPKPIVEQQRLPMLILPFDMVTARSDNKDDTLCFWLRYTLAWNYKQRERLETVINSYHVGHSKDGKTIFWQIDEQGRVRTGKMMLYKEDGHRDRETLHNFDWVHSALTRTGKYNPERSEMASTLFGMHLLDKYPHATINVVESEKSAIICATAFGHLEQHIWMATGGLSMLSREKLKPIIERKRNIFLYPDHDGVERWKEQTKRIGYDRLHVNTEFLNKYWEPKDGEKADIADVLLRIRGEPRQQSETYSKEIQNGINILERMIVENPSIGKLVSALDLEVVVE